MSARRSLIQVGNREPASWEATELHCFNYHILIILVADPWHATKFKRCFLTEHLQQNCSQLDHTKIKALEHFLPTFWPNVSVIPKAKGEETTLLFTVMHNYTEGGLLCGYKYCVVILLRMTWSIQSKCLQEGLWFKLVTGSQPAEKPLNFTVLTTIFWSF